MSKWWLVVDDKRIKRPKKTIDLPLAGDIPPHVKDRIIRKEMEALGMPHRGARLLRVNNS